MTDGDVFTLWAPPPANDGCGGQLTGEEHSRLSAEIASTMRRKLPPGIGCMVITFDSAEGGFAGYCSTGERWHCVKLLHELLQRLGGL